MKSKVIASHTSSQRDSWWYLIQKDDGTLHVGHESDSQESGSSAKCLIALAMLLCGGAVRLCSIVVKFGGFVMIAVRHVRILKFSSQRATTRRIPPRSQMSPDGVFGTDALYSIGTAS